MKIAKLNLFAKLKLVGAIHEATTKSRFHSQSGSRLIRKLLNRNWCLEKACKVNEIDTAWCLSSWSQKRCKSQSNQSNPRTQRFRERNRKTKERKEKRLSRFKRKKKGLTRIGTSLISLKWSNKNLWLMKRTTTRRKKKPNTASNPRTRKRGRIQATKMSLNLINRSGRMTSRSNPSSGKTNCHQSNRWSCLARKTWVWRTS